jgi:alpha-beta hydrolase superfamily lysophospholipase
MATANRATIISVHGTGDTAAEPDGPINGDHWSLTRSKFMAQLKQRLAGHGVEAEVVPHLWSGANSAMERERGARSLVKTIKRAARRNGGPVHVIGHSHGGNVANDAARMLNWSRAQRHPKIASITTVGTPFFRTRATGTDLFGAWLFAAIVALSILMIPAITAFASQGVTNATLDLVNLPFKDVVAHTAERRAMFQEAADVARASDSSLFVRLLNWMTQHVYPVASGLALLLMIPVATYGLARIRRASRRPSADTTIYSIWHPSDEAISFLRRLESVPLEPFPRWSLFRSSRTTGVHWGVNAVLTFILVGATFLGFDFLRGVNVLAQPFQSVGAYLVVIGIAGAPLVFMTAYLIYRLFAAIVLDLSLRGMLNNTIGGALIAMAFGRDGDHRIDKVSTCSHSYGTQDDVLANDVADRMAANAADASKRLFDRYRAAIFSVSADETNAINELAKDSMTWDSLIHTTYFDQPEVVDRIGDYIAGIAKAESADA